MKIIIFGDSLPLPKPRQGQMYDDTWPALLKVANPTFDILNRSKNKASTHELLREFSSFSESIEAFDLCIVQVGIVDCCPRPYPHFVHRLLEEFCGVNTQKSFNQFAYKLFWLYNRPWISEKKFETNLSQFINTIRSRTKECSVLLLKIAPAGPNLIKKIPNVERSIKRYNELLRLIAERNSPQVVLVDPYKGLDLESILIQDGHHLTRAGHEAVADVIGENIANCRLSQGSR